MNRCADRAIGSGDQLALADAFADTDDGMCGLSDMLRYRQNQLLGDRHLGNF